MCAIRHVELPLSTQLDESFQWLTVADIVAGQVAGTPPSGAVQSTTDRLWKATKKQNWIPDKATELQARVCVVGHFGVVGHRNVARTLKKIGAKFFWTGISKDFVQRCVYHHSLGY